MAALASRKRQFLRTTSIGMSLGLLMTALVPAVSFADSAMPYDFHAWNGNKLASGLFDNTKLIHKDGHQVVELTEASPAVLGSPRRMIRTYQLLNLYHHGKQTHPAIPRSKLILACASMVHGVTGM